MPPTTQAGAALGGPEGPSQVEMRVLLQLGLWGWDEHPSTSSGGFPPSPPRTWSQSPLGFPHVGGLWLYRVSPSPPRVWSTPYDVVSGSNLFQSFFFFILRPFIWFLITCFKYPALQPSLFHVSCLFLIVFELWILLYFFSAQALPVSFLWRLPTV